MMAAMRQRSVPHNAQIGRERDDFPSGPHPASARYSFQQVTNDPCCLEYEVLQ